MSGYVLRLRLSLPPSSNHRMIVVKGRMVLAPEHRKWKADAVEAIRDQLPAGFVPFVRAVELYLEQVVDTLASDISNRVKVLEDALTEAGVWRDDRQVAEIHQRAVGFTAAGEEPSVRVIITTADPTEHAERNRRLAESEARAAKEASKQKPKHAPRSSGLVDRGQLHFVGDSCPGGHLRLAGSAISSLAPPREPRSLAELATSAVRRPR